MDLDVLRSVAEEVIMSLRTLFLPLFNYLQKEKKRKKARVKECQREKA